MGRVILPCGNYATTPYRFVNPDVLVYSVEELCYVLKENAFLLDRDVMDRKLIQWLDGECGLKELAAKLLPLTDKKGTVSAFVMTILEYAGYYDRETLRSVEELLRQGANLSSYEKQKTRIDRIVAAGQFVEAMAEYDELLKSLPEVENELSARILHNKGVAMAGLFLFGQAAEVFRQSYEMYPAQETFIEYLAAKRMELDDAAYISFVAELPDAYEDSLELERRVEALRASWQSHIDKQRLDQMQQWKEDGENGRYYEETERIVQGLKQGYRFNAGET